MTVVPNRAVMGPRGRRRRSPIRRRPARARLATISGSIRSAASGRARDEPLEAGFERRGSDPLRAEPGQSPGGFGGRGYGGSGRETLPPEAILDGPQHPGFATEKMRDPADVEQDTVRTVGSRQGREPPAPVDDVVRQRGVGRRIGFGDVEAGAHGPGIGQRQTGPEPKGCGGCVDRHDPLRALHLADRDAGERIRRPHVDEPDDGGVRARGARPACRLSRSVGSRGRNTER